MVSACADANVHTDTFANMAEARQRGAVDRGWVPAFVPEQAYELRAAYEPGGPRRWGILNFAADDADRLRAQLRPEEVSLSGMRMDIPARIEWWPIALRNDLQPDTIVATGLRAYRTSSGEFIVAVNWNQGRAYYWKAASR
jgi:hypothetical protein